VTYAFAMTKDVMAYIYDTIQKNPLNKIQKVITCLYSAY